MSADPYMISRGMAEHFGITIGTEDAVRLDQRMRVLVSHAYQKGREAELQMMTQVKSDFLVALNDLAAWPDGDVGVHMDEPHAASVARLLLAKHFTIKHIASDDSEGGHHD